jgi:hypothetical protein
MIKEETTDAVAQEKWLEKRRKYFDGVDPDY